MRTDARDQPGTPETNEIAAQAHSSEEERPGEAAEKPLPLSGIRVVDVGTFLAGPYAASIMGEFGAEVLKVEYPIGGDPMRRFGAPTKRSDATLAWLSEARNKKSVTIDLRRPRGAELFIKLVSKSDVLVENFRPGTMEEWGLGWKVLSEANPGLVMLRVSGYGQTGPYRRRPGFAHIAHAIGGLSYLAGFPGETPVVPGTAPLGDYMSSLYGAIGVMLALRHKAKTGYGQVVDVGIYEAVFRQLDELAAAYGMFGKIREREGSDSFVAVPHGHFRTKEGKWVAIACTTDKMFERLAEAMGRPELASSSQYGEQRKRLAARDEVKKIARVGPLAHARGIAGEMHCQGGARWQAQQHCRYLRGRTFQGARQPCGSGSRRARQSGRAQRRPHAVRDARAHRQSWAAARQRDLRGDARAARTLGCRDCQVAAAKDHLA